MTNALDSLMVGTGALARLLDLTPQRVNQLAAAGVLQKLGRGRFKLGPAVRSYVAFLRDQPIADGSPASAEYGAQRARLVRIQADQAEMDFKKQQGRMIDVGEAVAPFAEQCRLIRGKFLGLATRVAPRVAGSDVPTAHTIIYGECCAILGELTADADAALQAEAAAADRKRDEK